MIVRRVARGNLALYFDGNCVPTYHTWCNFRVRVNMCFRTDSAFSLFLWRIAFVLLFPTGGVVRNLCFELRMYAVAHARAPLPNFLTEKSYQFCDRDRRRHRHRRRTVFFPVDGGPCQTGHADGVDRLKAGPKGVDHAALEERTTRITCRMPYYTLTSQWKRAGMGGWEERADVPGGCVRGRVTF